MERALPLANETVRDTVRQMPDSLVEDPEAQKAAMSVRVTASGYQDFLSDQTPAQERLMKNAVLGFLGARGVKAADALSSALSYRPQMDAYGPAASPAEMARALKQEQRAARRPGPRSTPGPAPEKAPPFGAAGPVAAGPPPAPVPKAAPFPVPPGIKAPPQEGGEEADEAKELPEDRLSEFVPVAAMGEALESRRARPEEKKKAAEPEKAGPSEPEEKKEPGEQGREEKKQGEKKPEKGEPAEDEKKPEERAAGAREGAPEAEAKEEKPAEGEGAAGEGQSELEMARDFSRAVREDRKDAVKEAATEGAAKMGNKAVSKAMNKFLLGVAGADIVDIIGFFLYLAAIACLWAIFFRLDNLVKNFIVWIYEMIPLKPPIIGKIFDEHMEMFKKMDLIMDEEDFTETLILTLPILIVMIVLLLLLFIFIMALVVLDKLGIFGWIAEKLFPVIGGF